MSLLYTPTSVSDKSVESPSEKSIEEGKVEFDDSSTSLSSVTAIVPHLLLDDIPGVPDGGWRAWLQVFACAMTLFASFGVVNAYGVFQAYYESNRLSHENSSVISLIGAMQLFLLYGLGPLCGKIFDSYGTILFPLGAFCIVFSQMMLSIAQTDKTYQYFLSQAILFGLGSATIFTPALAIISHYFRRRRGLALGLVATGSSLGGVIFPIVYQKLFTQIGFGWSVRVTAFICLFSLVFASMTLKTRLPLKKTSKREMLHLIDLGGFKDPRYCCAAAGAFFTFYGLFIPYFYIKEYAEAKGMSPELSQYLLPIINAATIPSRIIPGIIADITGPLNLCVPMTMISGILCLALWLPSNGDTPIIVFCILYGLFSGQFVSLLPTYLARITPQPIYGARLGAVYMVVAVANLVGTPTGGGLVLDGSEEGFRHLISFTGAIVTLGGLCMGCAWLLEARKIIEATPKEKLSWRSFRI